MASNVYVLGQTYDEFEQHGLKDTIEDIREEFSNYTSGDRLNHPWFCHDVGADPGEYLCHVHLIPTDPENERQWLADFEHSYRYKNRTSDRYVLYACDPRHGYLIIDILDDPGAHDVWKARYTKLPNYELAATDFCTYGPKLNIHK
jgi:hypothetical protein